MKDYINGGGAIKYSKFSTGKYIEMMTMMMMMMMMMMILQPGKEAIGLLRRYYLVTLPYLPYMIETTRMRGKAQLDGHRPPVGRVETIRSHFSPFVD